MPVKIDKDLPARFILEKEKVFVMTNERAKHQDIRPLRIIIVNLMPTKIDTEVQLLRCLTNTPLQIEVEFLHTSSYCSKHVSKAYLEHFYKRFEDVKEGYYDGLIITGAPVETLDFEDIDYWEELCEIMEWSKTHIHSTLHICWGAQAALYYHYGIQKHPLKYKKFGIFEHEIVYRDSKLLRGFNDVFYAPHSRHTTVYQEEIEEKSNLIISAVSKEAGVYLIESTDSKQVFITGHAEYDTDTLANEYIRDKERGYNPKLPEHYFSKNQIGGSIINNWRAHAFLLYANWINYYLYQTTPYILEEKGVKL